MVTISTYGYIRVSTREQNEDRQLIAMREQCISEEYIYMDKQSGKDFDRPAYRQLMEKLRPGDLLVVKSIDRLGRNYEEILEQWRHITKEIRSGIRVLDMPLLAEGNAAAKARGVKFGRDPIELPEDFPMYAELWLEGKVSSRWAGRELGISYRTFQRRARAFEAAYETGT